MPLTTSLTDCQRLADAVTSVGGVVPDVLAHLLQAYTLLSSHRATEAPEKDILEAALTGALDEKALSKLLPAAATAAMVNDYRRRLAAESEHVLLGEWHRQLAAGGADQILDSVRGKFDTAAAAIAHARSLFPMQSDPEHILDTAADGALEAWRALDGHIRVVDTIGTRIAAQFGPRLGGFSQVEEFANADGYKLQDRALFATDGDLVTDSALFRTPGTHRNSPWCRTALRLHSVESATERYHAWAAEEFDRIHSGPQGGWVGEGGVIHEHPVPPNPYRKVNA